jgi:hypothetical protein
MSRQCVPFTFLTSLLIGVILPLAVAVQASGARTGVPRVLGAYDGFIQNVDGKGGVGVIRSVIYRQDQRGFLGNAELFGADSLRFNAINFSGTFALDDVIIGAGRAMNGSVALLAGLETFEGDQGAAMMNPVFEIVPARGRPSLVSSIMLRPFAVSNLPAPDIAGTATGIIRSRRALDSPGSLSLDIPPDSARGTSLPGSFGFQFRGMPEQRFDLLATTSGKNQFVMISQGRTGRLVAEGTVTPASADKPTMVDALYRLVTIEGLPDFGAINFRVSR